MSPSYGWLMCFMYHFRCCLSHVFNPSTKYLPWLDAPTAWSTRTFLLEQKKESKWRAVVHWYVLAQPSVLSKMVPPSISTFCFYIKHWVKTNTCPCIFSEFCFYPSDKCEWKCVFLFTSILFVLGKNRALHPSIKSDQ